MKPVICRHHILLITALIGIVGTIAISGCKPAKLIDSTDTPKEDATQVSGNLDWSAWQRWVQTPPNVVLVADIDAQTQALIEKQTLLFLTVIGMTPNSSTGGISGNEITQLKDTFIESSSRKANSPVPSVERWDRYSNTVLRLQVSSIPTTIVALEAYIRRDQQDLSALTSASGDIGRQARSDLQWIDSAVKPLIKTLRDSKTTTEKVPTPEQARQQWKTFESDSLPAIATAIKKKTTATSTVNTDGSYTLKGNGQLVAIITVAGRDLYFPAGLPTPGLRFKQ